MLLIICLPLSLTRAQAEVEYSLFVPGSYLEPSLIKTLSQKTGVVFKGAKWYQDWSDPFDSSIAHRFYDAGLRPELTWQPQEGNTGVEYSQVIEGKYDDYLISTAQSIKSLPFKIRLSLAPEMNTPWVSWSNEQQPENTPENFKAFWRYVVQLFRKQEVTNVEWVWAPNIHHPAEKYSYPELYPGDEYVHYLGLDGYNWGTTQIGSTWQSFEQVFGASYQELTKISTLPILITETASAEEGGDKALWIREMKRVLPEKFPRIIGVTWFNMHKEADWRVDSSESSLMAFSGRMTEKAPNPLGVESKVESNEVQAVESKNSTPRSSSLQSIEADEKVLPKIEVPNPIPQEAAKALIFTIQTPESSSPKPIPARQLPLTKRKEEPINDSSSLLFLTSLIGGLALRKLQN